MSKVFYEFIHGDCLEALTELPSESVHCCVTSPPYWGLRNYGVAGQLGLEPTIGEYVLNLVLVFREVSRVLRKEGTLWLNLGDSYAGSWGNAGGQNRGRGTQRKITTRSIVKDRAVRNGSFVPPGKYGDPSLGVKPKDLCGIPWRVAFALQSDGWYLRQDIVWHKPNPMPESVRDRCTKAHEYVFLLAKSASYYFDSQLISEPATYAGCNRGGSTNRYKQNSAGMDNRQYDRRNKRSVWSVQVRPYRVAHFATFPPALIEPCILAGCPQGGVVLDPFLGSGTTAVVANSLNRSCLGIELNQDYLKIANQRMVTK